MDIHELVEAFNSAVGSGRWDRYLQAFTDSATLDFVGPTVGEQEWLDAGGQILGCMPAEPGCAVPE